MTCVLCDENGGDVLWKNALVRVVLATDEPAWPGFCRVIWHAHVAEFSDLESGDRHYLMQAVCAVERAVRRVMQPDKINLASLGNQVPHLHWHVIPRFANDGQFPLPVWAPRQRQVCAALQDARAAQATRLREAVVQEMQQLALPTA